MREKEFLEKYKTLKFLTNIYYILDDEGKVIIDENEIRYDFETFLKKIIEETK